MKKLILFILLLPVCLIGRAQGWYAGVEGGYFLGEKPRYWQVAVTGSYTKAFSQFISLDANASLYNQNYNEAAIDVQYVPYPGWKPTHPASNSHTFGGSLGINVMLKLNGPVSLFTGPKVDCNFYQPEYYEFHRATAQWRVGLNVDVWKLRVRASWDIMMTNRNDSSKGSAITVGVAYKL